MMETSKPSKADIIKSLGRTPEDFGPNSVLKDAKGHEIPMFKYGDLAFPPFGELSIAAMGDTEMREDDVFLSGYPKTGSNWTNQLIRMVLQRGVQPAGNKANIINKSVGLLELAHPNLVASLPSPRVLNSHVRFGQLPRQLMSKKTKIVLTVRNPKDTLASYYNHHRQPTTANYTGDFEDFLTLFLQGKLYYGGYFEYYKDWARVIKENPDHPILVLSYEDMKEDLEREVRRLAQFLDVDLEDTKVKVIAEAGQFDNVVKAGSVPKFITRKGQVGDWKNWLTVAQNEGVDAAIAENMAGLDFYTPRYTL